MLKENEKVKVEYCQKVEERYRQYCYSNAEGKTQMLKENEKVKVEYCQKVEERYRQCGKSGKHYKKLM